MDAFDRFERHIDYDNHYSLKKALSVLSREFDMALSKNNIHHARVAVYVARRLYNKIKANEVNYFQKNIAKQLRSLMSNFGKRLQSDFSMGDLNEIEQTITDD